MTTTNCTNTYIVPTSNREVTKPYQSAFMAQELVGAANVSGDGTAYTCVFTTEVFDQNADFANPTFTAPVTGRYLLNGNATFSDIGAGYTLFFVDIITSNRQYRPCNLNGSAAKNSGNGIGMTYSQLCDMDAGDVAYILFTSSGGAKTNDYFRGFFSGALIV